MTVNFTPNKENQLLSEYWWADQQTSSFRSTASPYLSQVVGDLYRQNRDANPGAVVAAAQAVVGGQMSFDGASQMLLDSQKMELANVPKKKRGGLGGWLDSGLSKLRTASRWTMAALNFVPQTVQGAAAQMFDKNDNIDGWFISTDLGTLIKNDEVAGDGFFVGGKASQLQAERARRYRGEIDGKAWTIGRGTAHLFTQPGSKWYNILSGLVDAGAALAVPSIPGFQAAKGAIATAGMKAGELGGIGLYTRSAAGLLAAESAAIDPNKFRAWLGSRGARQVVDKIVEFGKTAEGAYDDGARFALMRRTFPKMNDTDFLLKLTETRTPDEVMRLLEDSGGKGLESLDLSNRTVVEALSQKFSRVERLAASLPGRHIVLRSGNARDISASVENMDNYLKLYAKQLSSAERDSLVLNYAKVAAKGNNPHDALKEIESATVAVMRGLDMPDEAIDNILSTWKGRTDLTVHGQLGSTGGEFVTSGTYDAVDGSKVSGPLSTAWLESEMMKTAAVTLPDPRKIRRITGDIRWLFMTKGKNNPELFGNMRLPQAMVEAFQNELWKPITLLTPGYVYRNMADSALRLSFAPGLDIGVLHPLHWIMIAARKQNKGNVLGAEWEGDLITEARKLVKSGVAKNMEDAKGLAAEKILKSDQKEFIEATGQRMRELYGDNEMHRQSFKNRVWYPAKRDDPKRFAKGIKDQISLFHDDLVMKSLAEGYDDLDQAVEDIVTKLTDTPEGRTYVENLQARWQDETLYDRSSGVRMVASPQFIRPDDSLNAENIRTYVQDSIEILQHATGKNRTLIDAVATGLVKNAKGESASIFKTTRTGVRYNYSDEWRNAVEQLVNDPNVQLPEWVKFAEDVKTVDDAAGGRQFGYVAKWARKSVDHFFSEVYPRRSAYLMQSPAFRQFYYQKVSTLVDELDSAGVNDLAKALKGSAKNSWSRKWLNDWVGDNNLARRIWDKIENPAAANGTVSLREMDAYAKGFALDSTKELFYSAANRSNFSDILRIVAPFGSAWAEIMSAWGKMLTSNPDALRKIGVTVQGIANADPDADGKGFFYKNPDTGEYVFNYPLSDKLGPLTSLMGGMGALGGAALFGAPGAIAGAVGGGVVGKGLEATAGIPGINMTAPAKTLTMGLNILPGLGPVAQIAANRVLGKMPALDDVRRLLSPYGEPDISGVGPVPIPAWARKVFDAFSDPENNRVLGDMKIETMRALAATGNYDLAKPAEQERLENDADTRARILMVLRGLGQFVGPTRPTPEFKVETFAGDKMGAELSKAFRDFQNADYDTAVENFISTFGDDAFLYMASKTKSAVGGLDATREFGRFEQENGSLFARYGNVAGYFAPVGNNFDYQVFIRQLNTGQRKKLKPSELVQEAQALVGKSIYKNVVRSVGGNPTGDQKEYLRTVREQLYARYPGFQLAPMTFNQLTTRIEEIRMAVSDPILDNNDVAVPTRQYMAARDQALAEARNRGFQGLGGKKVADLRAWLRSVADNLVAGYPEFERIYNRVLFDEIDIDSGE